MRRCSKGSSQKRSTVYNSNQRSRSFYEKEPEIARDVQNLYAHIHGSHGFSLLKNLDTSKFRDGLNLNMMQREMYLASEGYLWEITQRNEPIDVKTLEKDFLSLLDFWKSIYYKESTSIQCTPLQTE